MLSKVVTYYLEMTSPDQLRPARPPAAEVSVVRAEVPCPPFNRFLYAAVGGDWLWYDRLTWSYARWLSWLSRPEVETWVAYVRGTPAGYFELEQEGRSVEIAYFGLLAQFIGQGIGGRLLTRAVRRGWELDVDRVWVHTCTLDHPQALPNYLARGFQVFDRVETWTVQRKPSGPWPGAYEHPSNRNADEEP